MSYTLNIKSISWKAVVLSNLAFFVSSMIAFALIGVIMKLPLLQGFLPVGENVLVYPWLMYLIPLPLVIVSLLLCVLAGYIAGRIAKHDEKLHGGLSALYYLITGSLMLPLVFQAYSPLLLIDAVGTLLGPFMGVFGGYLAQRRHAWVRSITQ